MELVQLDDRGRLFLSPAIDDWEPIHNAGISAVIDLDGDVDHGIPTLPGHILYVYFPIYDEGLPNLARLNALARLAAGLIERGERVLSHCGMGLNRSALLAGLTLTYLGMSGKDAIELLREKRPGALFNENFADFLKPLPPQRLKILPHPEPPED